MTTLRWLSRHDAADRFPPPSEAFTEPNGLLAAGGDLEPERLLAAYRRGIFHGVRVSRSLRRSLIKGGFELRIDTAFSDVVAGCAAPRHYGGSTWITAEMASAYARLHRLGWAHSFETWRDGELVGGLYGVAIGRVFFGESMFARATDASKVALVNMAKHVHARGFELIDCQVASAHVTSLGASNIPRAEFLTCLDEYCEPRGIPCAWS
jgi:leucyl/phenylalanyl-tRNA---protein transferase